MVKFKLIQVPLEPKPAGRCQRKSSKDSRIRSDIHYLAKNGEHWHLGTMHEQWYGWNLFVGSHSIQLDTIDLLFEFHIDE